MEGTQDSAQPDNINNFQYERIDKQNLRIRRLASFSRRIWSLSDDVVRFYVFDDGAHRSSTTCAGFLRRFPVISVHCRDYTH